jgi:hypothetical protein
MNGITLKPLAEARPSEITRFNALRHGVLSRYSRRPSNLGFQPVLKIIHASSEDIWSQYHILNRLNRKRTCTERRLTSTASDPFERSNAAPKGAPPEGRSRTTPDLIRGRKRAALIARRGRSTSPHK